MENRTVSLWINQSEKKSRTVSLWINPSEKKSRTVSLWMNQSENVPCQRVRKRDEPELEIILLCFKWRNFLFNKDVFIEEIQKITD